MKRFLVCALLLSMAVVGYADAGQFRISRPDHMRKRKPPPGRRESRLEIINQDDRGYAIDVDYNKNRLQFEHRARGDVFVPANSSVTLVFDDDDDWRIYGDHDSLKIEIRAGRTTRLRLETKTLRRQVGLFAAVDDGRRTTWKQLFKYAERQGRPQAHRPTPKPTPKPQPHPQPAPKPQPAPPPSRPNAGPGGHGKPKGPEAKVPDSRPGQRR